ncbi:MAG: twin-arginine translocation signal domain-containing protein [Actinobacteria bacterium]|nr:MAG: twin-arginine translocation signal domain-containing protein [Actinomycetota bacterium]
MHEQMEMSRRGLLRLGAAGAALGGASIALPRPAYAEGPESVQVAEIYQLQADFHRAKTTQDLDLMMSLWADDGVFTNNGTGTTYEASSKPPVAKSPTSWHSK